MKTTLELDPLLQEIPDVGVPNTDEKKDCGRLFVAAQVITYTSLSVSLVGPIAYTILFLSSGNLSSARCISSEADWLRFWEVYSEKRMFPFWISFYMLMTRSWVFYETQRYFLAGSGLPLASWARKWRLIRSSVVLVYSMLMDTANIAWISNANDVCYSHGQDLVSMSRNEKHMLYSMCFHALNIDIVPRLILYVSTALAVCLFVLVMVHNRYS